MCGRFIFKADDDDERLMNIVRDSLPGINDINRFNLNRGDVYPSQEFPIIHEQGNQTDVTNMFWGYPPASKKSKSLLINARAETADQKFTFRYDFKNHRCIILATGFYEWSKQKEQNLFYDNSGLLFLGGLYTKTNDTQDQESQDRFVILTKKPDEIVGRVHNRMPVLIPPHLAKDWLTEPNMAKEIINNYSINLKDKVIPKKEFRKL